MYIVEATACKSLQHNELHPPTVNLQNKSAISIRNSLQRNELQKVSTGRLFVNRYNITNYKITPLKRSTPSTYCPRRKSLRDNELSRNVDTVDR